MYGESLVMQKYKNERKRRIILYGYWNWKRIQQTVEWIEETRGRKQTDEDKWMEHN